MAHTPLFSMLRRCARLALSAERAGRETAEHVEESLETWRLTRRAFLGTTAAVAAAAAVPGLGRAQAGRRGGPRIAVVGAGMAGLHCAWQLRRAGLAATVYEASSRVGGRMFSSRGRLADGQVMELGGELIDTSHRHMRALAGHFGVRLDDLRAEERALGLHDVWFVGGRTVSEREIVDAFRPLAPRIARDAAAAEANPEEEARFDAMNIVEYLDAAPDTAPLIRALLITAYTGEYGLESEEQSALNLLYMIDAETVEPFRIFGDSDERFHVHDGNDTLIHKLAGDLEGSIQTGMTLAAVREESGGGYRLTFAHGASGVERVCDVLVLALPFTLLRRVHLGLALSPEKENAIRTLGYGTNAKLMGQFSDRVWRDRYRSSGSTVTDSALQTVWETTRGQAGRSGVLTNFLGGRVGWDSRLGTPEERYLATVQGVEAVYPGTAATYRAGSAVRMHWPTLPLALGSYACYRVGQWSLFGLEGERAGNVHFCGEHCSGDYQGFMEGAAETGAAVAAVIAREAGARR